MFENGLVSEIIIGFWESIYMTVVSSLAAYVIGLPLGLILVATDKDGISPAPLCNKILGFIINVIRSVPFLLLLVAMMPITKFVVGTVIGTKATIVVLVASAAPFIARLVESSLKEVDKGVIEAAQSMGASPLRIMCRVLLPEAKPSLLVGSAITMTTILGYSAMAGFCGGGGLGAIAINYGYYRQNNEIMLIMIVLLVIIVQVLQEIGLRISKNTDKRL